MARGCRCLQTYLRRWTHRHLNSLFTRDLIQKNTEKTRNHLTPEIALNLITPSCPLWKARPEECPFPDPFWAFYWPGGQAVTRFILDNPCIVKGLMVIDVGSGCGASAIAAVKCGAKVALANDIDPVASVAAEMNAELNNVSLSVSTDNLIPAINAMEYITNDNLPWDVIIVGDLFYDLNISERVMAWVEKCSSLGKTILIGDPGRYTFSSEIRKKTKLSSINVIATYQLPENSCLENNGFHSSSVWSVNRIV